MIDNWFLNCVKILSVTSFFFKREIDAIAVTIQV